jgi:hypothetical protein
MLRGLGDEKVIDRHGELGLCSRWAAMQRKELWNGEDRAKGDGSGVRV